MFELSDEGVSAALGSGATYADARVVIRREQAVSGRNGAVEGLRETESAGIGVRALVGSSWGFFATEDLTPEGARSAGRRAAAIALASATVSGPALELAAVPAVVDTYETPHMEDPFEVSLTEKAELAIALTGALVAGADITKAEAIFMFWDTEKWFVSSQGSRIHQHLVESGGGMNALAVKDGESQIRSYPQSYGQFETGGYEVIRGMAFEDHTGRVADEAAALLRADHCPSGEVDLILDGAQLSLQIHESVGHAIELDRILGWEAAFAGTSFLPLQELGSFRYGSPLMNITADATIPGALGTYGYDDEGTPAQNVPIVDQGTWVGVLSGRDSAAIAGVEPGGMVRGDGYARMPMVRMTNVGLLPGESSFDEMVADTKDGIYMSVNRSWSIDDQRLNFQFGTEIAWEIKEGKLGRMLRNPTYTGITPTFWGSLDRLAGPDEWVHWGTPNCGKGQPMQTGHTGHSASPARFRNVRVGVTG